jgi:hypothetical protein
MTLNALITGIRVAHIDLGKEFAYHDSIINCTLASDTDVDRLIEAATAAFGAHK